jgi:16S rRNA (cytidine1402-2'-O)-methyltransferase
MGTLYVVATPIGNLEDVGARALRILSEVSLVAAEDTRVARKLLARYGIEAKLMSFNDHSKPAKLRDLVDGLSRGDVAYVTDAGTPGISDPGASLVAAARAASHQVVPIPGPSAVVAALSAAGLNVGTFRFVGFLPRGTGPLRRFFEGLVISVDAVVAFESPNRLPRSLAVLAEVLPERRVVVCRELTKVHEEIFVGTADKAAKRFRESQGEMVLIIEGATGRVSEAPDEGALREEIGAMKAVGLTRAQAVPLLQRRHRVGRRQLYQLWLAVDPGEKPPG